MRLLFALTATVLNFLTIQGSFVCLCISAIIRVRKKEE